MTAPTPDTGNPLYAEAIALLAAGRVVLRAARLGKASAPGPETVEGYVIIDGNSAARCDVHMRRGGTWGCDNHPDDEPCAERFAAQIVTGYAHLGGRSQ